MIGVCAFPRIGFQNRSAGLFDLQEQRVLLGGHQVFFAKAVAAAGQHETDGQSFHISFPRGRKRLVKIIDIENNASFRGGIRAEIQQMAITTDLNLNPTGRRRGQVGRHIQRRSTIKCEG